MDRGPRFADRITLEDKTLGALLVDAPVSVVELFGRWHSFDPQGAKKEMRIWRRRGGSVRLIGERMLEARKKFKVHPSRSLEIDYRHRMKDSVKQIVHVMLGGDLTEPSLNFKDSDLPPVDYLFYSVNPSDLLTISIAAIVVGPFSNPDMYRRRRHDWLMKAFALSWIYDRVILLLPHREALHSYREWIQRFSTRAAGRFAARDPSSVALANCRPSVEVVALPNKGHTRPSD